MKWFFDKVPAWYNELPISAQLDVMNLMHERGAAVRDWKDGSIDRDKAREIVAKCNREIERLAGCAS